MRLWFIIFLLAVSCDSPLIQEVKESYPDGSPKVVYFYEVSNEDSLLKKHREYHANGQLRIEGQYDENEKRTGVWRAFYKDGVLQSQAEFLQGYRNGHTLVYYTNGVKRYSGKFALGKKTGTWTYTDSLGIVLRKEEHP
jgi:antitoxin component YwqK of YwqJK toxin-antitoxin module